MESSISFSTKALSFPLTSSSPLGSYEKAATMSVNFDIWHPVYQLQQVDAPTRVCNPKMEASTFSGICFSCSGGNVLFERKNEGAQFRMIVNAGNGGVNERQPDGKILVHQRQPPFVFELPSTREWNISSTKLVGATTLGRKITIEFGEGGSDQTDIRILTITIPITRDSDQAAVFLYGLDWAAKVVAANMAFVEFHVAKNAGAGQDGHGGL
jgi:hypothetical protein